MGISCVKNKIFQILCVLSLLLCISIGVEASKVAVVIEGPINTMQEKAFRKYATAAIKKIYPAAQYEIVPLADVYAAVFNYRVSNGLHETSLKYPDNDYIYTNGLNNTDVVQIGKNLGCDEVMYAATDWKYEASVFQNSATVDMDLFVQVFDVTTGNTVFEEKVHKNYNVFKNVGRFGGGVRFGSEYRATFGKAFKLLSYKPANNTGAVK